MANTILVIDDDRSMLELAEYHLQSQGYKVVTAETGTEGLKQADEQRFDLVITDFNLPDIDGIEIVKRIKETVPETEVIVATGFSSVTKAVDAIKAGAFYFVEKPIEFEELLALIEKALERRRQAVEIEHLRGRLRTRESYVNIIGSSKAMQDIYETIDSVAESDANVLIIGESGTGKELIANAIHFKSLRAKKPFVKINCAALPKELIESELFGHTKGAFTGAATDKIGLIGQADGGSLLLDEIGEMPVELQPKLLRVLQERVYFRLGSEKPHAVNFRLISATNRNPLEAVRSGALREDLYYRINTIEIRVPSLAERAEDIQHLAEHFLKHYTEKYNRPVQTISQAAYERMFAYQFPGNVRELQNIIERSVLLSKGKTIEVSQLPFAQGAEKFIGASASSATSATNTATAVQSATHFEQPESSSMSSSEPTLDQLGQLIVKQIPDPQPDEAMNDIFEQIELSVVIAALERTKGNKQAAAALLGLYRPRLYSIIKRHNLQNAPK
ncbi:MAG: sigma-54 dependent transcriptional regulator [Pyrinomonadaceae bacterium]